MSKKILYVVNVDWFFISHRLPIALAAQKDGYEIHLATKFTQYQDFLSVNNIHIHNVNFGRSSLNPLRFLACIIRMISVFNAVKPDIAHLVTIGPVICGGIASRLTRVPGVVAAISGLGYVFANKSFRANCIRLIVNQLYKCAIDSRKTILIFQNTCDYDKLYSIINFNSSGATIIKGSGVDLSVYKPLPVPLVEKPIVVMASRLLKSKGVCEYVAAARVLKSKGANADFYLAGEPDYENPDSITLEQIETWKSEGFIKILGYRSDMAKVISDSCLVVFPSYYGEGLPKILIEAAACGRAVITTDHPGCRDAILPGITGVLVAPRDVNSLADAVMDLLNNPDMLVSMGQAGREYACKEFAIEKVIDGHLAVYERLVASS